MKGTTYKRLSILPDLPQPLSHCLPGPGLQRQQERRAHHARSHLAAPGTLQSKNGRHESRV